MKRKILYAAGIILTVICLVLLMLALFRRDSGKMVSLTAENGILDLKEYSLAETTIRLGGGYAFYGEKFLSEENSCAPPDEFDGSLRYGTHKLTIISKPDECLTLTGYSVDYSTRVFVNGSKVLEIGKVSSDPEASTPRIGYMTIPVFTGDDGIAEILIEYSNFVHPDGGFVPTLLLSSPYRIDLMQRVNDLRSIALGGSLLMFAMYFLLCAAFQRQLQYVALAACCLLLGLRDQDFFVVHLLRPDYDWNIAYRFLVMMISLQFPALLILLSSLWPGCVKKKWNIAFSGLIGVVGILHFVLSTMYTAKLTTLSYILCVPYALIIVAGAVKRTKNGVKPTSEGIVTLAGYLLLFASQFYEAVLSRQVQSVTRNGTAPIFMLIFVMLIAASIGMGISRRERELEESRRQSAVLEQLNLLKNDFLHRVAHELRTPLTVMSGYAQLTERQILRSTTDEKTIEHLKTISSEAKRLSDLVSKLTEMLIGRTEPPEMRRVDVKKLLSDSAEICRPMLLKNSNSLVIECPDELYIMGNREMLMQLFINLAANSNRHTQNGVVTFKAEKERQSGILVRVADNGDGIPKEHIDHIFENGYSPDNGSGLGLTICKDAAEIHGGELKLESTGDSGTVFVCRFPEYKDGRKEI